VKNIAVVSIDQAKARFYVLRRAERPKEQWSPELHFTEEIPNIWWQNQRNESLSGGQRFSYHVGLRGLAQTMHGFDDHLSRHQHEIARRFSAEILEKITSFIAQEKIDELILSAEKKMLGELREKINTRINLHVKIIEVTFIASKLSSTSLHDHLAKAGYIPARQPPIGGQETSFVRKGQWRRRAAPSPGQEDSTL
jgi:protein required for attachment to host cells